MKYPILFLAFLTLWTGVAVADECPSCVERKRNVCAKECQLVPEEKSLVCQRDCVFQYCTHRCEADDKAFNQFRDLDCSTCLDNQYVLCETKGPIGSNRTRAICKIGCSETRCKPKCTARTPTDDPKDRKLKLDKEL